MHPLDDCRSKLRAPDWAAQDAPSESTGKRSGKCFRRATHAVASGPVHWDPWWGRICAPVQDSRTVDELTYKAGLGVRWDFPPGYTMRFAYEKTWFDFEQAGSTPDFDQFKLGVALRW